MSSSAADGAVGDLTDAGAERPDVAHRGEGPARSEITYGPESQLRNPRQFWSASRTNLRIALGIAPRLMMRNLRGQYRTSKLGYLWIVAPAIAITGVWLYLESTQVVDSGETGIPYGVFVLTGTLLWLAFTEALVTPIQQLSSAATMLSKVSFPAESLLLAGLYTVFVNAAARLVIVVPVFAVTGVRPTWSIVLFPVGLVALVLFGFTAGLLLAPVGALYQDVGRLITIGISWVYLLTPVAYVRPPAGGLGVITRLNPISPLLDAARGWLTGAPAMPTTGWFIVVGLAAVGFVVGWFVFRLSVPHLIDRISA